MDQTAKLSATVVNALQPQARPYRVWDTKTPQLFLRVQPSGIKSFNVQWKHGTSRSLGKWPGTTVESARARALTDLHQTDKLGKPQAIIDAERPRVRTLRDFITDHYQPWSSENRKWGDGAANRVLSVFAEFSDHPLDQITALKIEEWRTRRIKAGVSVNTCNRDLATLKSALACAVKWSMLDADPLKSVKQSYVDSTRVRYLSAGESKRLRNALAARDAKGRATRASNNTWRVKRRKDPLPELGPDDYCDHLTPAVLVSLNTGLRRGELTSLEWSDVDLKLRMLAVRAAASKSGKPRHVPLNNECRAVLTRWKKQTGGTGRVFAFLDAKKAWVELLKKASIKEFRWHDMRHDFASKLVQAGVDLNTVRALLGHADLKMVIRYAHLQPGHLAAAVAKLVMK